ncbi:efflux RND transporter periplasmic adaptor subunit [Candidatus Hydrogenosomobacter endosymbioticus]|uniref:RND efflux pump membrane fusion protein barrel-sandwich domain-containing protein n=1 Tax=Candidatus Hydrogenosomobacter endosymbioticus TaxID=2558174 RepID=A0ABN6L3L8_9PROT|nr:efflux RND transporter periplasmic adaptor subunit [Candidatus Hydrogenosomobacter endosymbioticus]BDB96559.1 hypothetical protein HYD_6920 [Candidatus Hydrogenosomobacter endosymbioticus]
MRKNISKKVIAAVFGVCALSIAVSVVLVRRNRGNRVNIVSEPISHCQHGVPANLDCNAQSKKLTIGALGRIEPKSRVIRVSHNMGQVARVQDIHVSEGAAIKKGQLIAVFKDYDVEKALAASAEANVRALKSRLVAEKNEKEFAEKEAKRHEAMFAAKATSQSKKDEADKNLKKALATVKKTEAEIESAEAAANLEKVKLEQCVLRAPIDGTILRINTRPGEKVGEEGVVEMADLSEIEVVADVYEHDIGRIRVGGAAEILISGVQTPIIGKVIAIGFQVGKSSLRDTGPDADQDVRTIEVRIDLPKQQNSSRLQHGIGMQVNVRFVNDSRQAKASPEG